MDDTMMRCSRRTFLTFTTLAVPVAAASASLWLRQRLLACRGCGAAGRPHYFHGSDALHCPNCGINIRSGRFEVPHGGARYARAHDPRNGTWAISQVPFPNPELVFATAKPLATLSGLRW